MTTKNAIITAVTIPHLPPNPTKRIITTPTVDNIAHPLLTPSKGLLFVSFIFGFFIL
jgi:hypothetical protein